MRTEPVKAFGGLSPVTVEALEAFNGVCEAWNIDAEAELAGDLLRFSFEGVFFPIDDIIDAVTPFVTERSQGRFDVIDIENWTITRYTFTGGSVTKGSRGLNDVLNYSGH